MRLAIADPPYPMLRAAHPRNDSSRARRWYDDSYRKTGDARFASDHHENAAEWDDPARHRALMEDLEARFDGWAIATAHDGLPVYGELPRGARVMIWHRPNAGAGASRLKNVWEPVIIRPPADRISSRLMGGQVPDLLTAAAPRTGFAGAKPPDSGVRTSIPCARVSGSPGLRLSCGVTSPSTTNRRPHARSGPSPWRAE